MLKHLDLFSGIGGFSLGLESTGRFKTVAFCEIEPHLREHLGRHWRNVPIHEDIRDLSGEDIGTVDLVCGGPPCQPASRAGQQRGAHDDRWLWGEAIRIVRECRPRWVCFENPLGIYDVGLTDILAELERLGYANADDRGRRYIAPIEIPACALGAFHIRNRVWILGHAKGIGRSEGRPESEVLDGWPTAAGAGIPSDHEWIQCHDGKFRAVEPGIPLLAHAVPGRVAKVTAFGNAVVPQIVAAIGRAIWQAEAST